MADEAKSSESKEEKEIKEAITTPPKKGKTMIIIIAAVILLSVIGALLYFMILKKPNKDTGEAAAPPATHNVEAEKKDEHGGGHEPEAKNEHGNPHGEKSDKGPAGADIAAPISLYKNLEDFLVDLKASGSSSFIKINITLKADKQDTLKIIDDKLPVIRDSFITYLRELKTDDLYGSSGLFILKQELLTRINKIVAPGIIEEIYIQNILTR